jgi:TRAP-type mannitol/chloroaromatic compound transport system permease small subunit
MIRYIDFADRLSAWVGKAFGWAIMMMVFGIGWEVLVRRILNHPTTWSFDVSFIMYGTLFMMGGAYTLSRDAHVRADFIYRLWTPQNQARLDLLLHVIFFFPGVSALIFAGWKYAGRSVGMREVSINSPAGVPVYQFKAVIVAAGVLLFIQGIAQVLRCIVCMRTGDWYRAADDVEETEKLLLMSREAREAILHGGEAIDVPSGIDGDRRP